MTLVCASEERHPHEPPVPAGAYDELYLPDAMEVLGDFFDYAVNDYGAEGDEVAELFAMSSLGRGFEVGEPRLVGGMSGAELFARLAEERGGGGDDLPAPTFRAGRTREYWVGWVSAYVQWRFGLTFFRLFASLPFDELVALYHPWHEASEERFCELVRERLLREPTPTNLARLRQSAGITQRELAFRSGVSLRSIQMYEQRHKDINKAAAATLASLSRSLYCPMESLMEPEVDVPALSGVESGNAG